MTIFVFPDECTFCWCCCWCWRKIPFGFNGVILTIDVDVETPLGCSSLLLLLLLLSLWLMPWNPFEPLNWFWLALIITLPPLGHNLVDTLLTLLLLLLLLCTIASMSWPFFMVLILLLFSSLIQLFSDLNSIGCAFEFWWELPFWLLFCPPGLSADDKLGFLVIITFLDVEVVLVINSLLPLESCWMTFVDFRLTVEADGFKLKCYDYKNMPWFVLFI